MATISLFPLVWRCRRFSLSLKRECNPSLGFTYVPLPTSCRSAGNHPCTWQASARYLSASGNLR